MTTIIIKTEALPVIAILAVKLQAQRNTVDAKRRDYWDAASANDRHEKDALRIIKARQRAYIRALEKLRLLAQNIEATQVNLFGKHEPILENAAFEVKEITGMIEYERKILNS